MSITPRPGALPRLLWSVLCSGLRVLQDQTHKLGTPKRQFFSRVSAYGRRVEAGTV